MAELEKLLDVWAERDHHRGKGFIRDGIIDPDRWGRSPRKVLLLLKEAYNAPGSSDDWDLREAIREEWRGPKYKIWWTAASWCYAAQNATPHIPEYPCWTEEGRAAASGALLSSACINIKKSGGRSNSIDDDIKLYVDRDGDLLRQEIDLISPDIVLCGNTWWAVKHLWPNACQVYDFAWKIDSVLFIDFWHPANHFPNALNYYAVGCLLQNGIQESRSTR